MREYLNLGDWIRDRFKTQVVFAEKIGVKQGRVSRWMSGEDGISDEYQEKIRKLGYKGPWPERKAKATPAASGEGYVTREDFAGLEREVELLREDLEKTKRALIGAIGAIRQLAKASQAPHIQELLE